MKLLVVVEILLEMKTQFWNFFGSFENFNEEFFVAVNTWIEILKTKLCCPVPRYLFKDSENIKNF